MIRQMSQNLPTTLPVLATKKENYRTTTLTFENKIGQIRPGQFVMLWLPGVDEKPVCVGHADDEIFEVTVSAVGPWSEAIQKVKKNDKLGIRGHFGNAFRLPKKGGRICCVGGGFGVVPVYAAARAAKAAGVKVDFILGAREKRELLYTDRLEKVGKLHVATNDGSVGTKGFVTDVLEKLLAKNKYDSVLTCGPEVMMLAVAKMAKAAKTPSQLSLERYMKCGFGICGSCCLDDSGKRVCADGTVFPGYWVLQQGEMGHRAGTGAKV